MKTSFFSSYIFSKEKKEEFLSLLKIDDPFFSLIEDSIKKQNSLSDVKDSEIR